VRRSSTRAGGAAGPGEVPIASLLWPGVAWSWNRRSRSGWRACRRRCSLGRRSTSTYWRSTALLGEPYTKQLAGKLRELRFYLDRRAVRITCWIAEERRIILLTVFYKTRTRETREVERARWALGRCIGEAHTPEGEED
jgi:hypothetical protein